MAGTATNRQAAMAAMEIIELLDMTILPEYFAL
jgi:hypothetical protein